LFYLSSPDFDKCMEFLKSQGNVVYLSGLTESQRAHMAYLIKEKTERPIIFITHNEVRARQVYEDLLFYSGRDVYLLPSKDLVLFDIKAQSREGLLKRVGVLKEAFTSPRACIVASCEALMFKLVPSEVFKKHIRTLKVGDTVDFDEVVRYLADAGYDRVDLVEFPGHFSVRGGIIDVFPPLHEGAFRIEFFDNEVDSIRIFDVETQRSVEKVQEILIHPAREVIAEKPLIESLPSKLEKEFEEYRERHGKNREVISKLHSNIKQMIEKVRNLRNPDLLGKLLMFLYEEESESLFEYMPSAVLIMDEMDLIEKKLKLKAEEFSRDLTELLNRGEAIPKMSGLLFTPEELLIRAKNHKKAFLSFFPMASGENSIRFNTKSATNYYGKINLFINDLKSMLKRGYKVVILSDTREKGESIANSLRENGITAIYTEERQPLKEGHVAVISGSVSKGFEYIDQKFMVINYEEISGIQKVRRTAIKKPKEGYIKDFGDLDVGDYVVHVNHGIGIYMGIEKIVINGISRDYLKIKYAGEDRLYVPVEHMDMIQKYVGGDAKVPKLNRLSSTEWQKTKAKVKKKIQDVAKKLLELYAARHTIKGFAFSPDTVWQKQFEEAFPYEETEDQLKAIEEIKKDMEEPRPMDRLLCGDVGFGKTEVAFRAAFKAVMDGKQVAFLCPTTILAYQHYINAQKRFKDFPVRVEMLSRFRSKSEQAEIIRSLKNGSVDIIIGTHRLLQKDIEFKDLGLLIIDEEQRFGVMQKEQLKAMRKKVDVLSLTATPIPRTLYMSLMNIRDLSILENPPENRFPVQVYVMEFKPDVIREAILKEIARGGQVFFVYNRVEDIDKMAHFLKNLVPEARLVVAHGKMDEEELEVVMLFFLQGEYDILLYTTIIETGIDIPNVNTLIVFDADRMGLSQLYQLKGRVGRSERIAYAYFTYRSDKVLSEVAVKRLKALTEFTDLGSGIKIALRDLEIRGAGNLLGVEQHGHMEQVGYEMYMKLLEETIREMKGEKTEEEISVTIDLNVDAYIDTQFIENHDLRLDLYRKISVIGTREEMYDLIDETTDRFGDIPESTLNLIKIAYIKALAKKLSIVSVTRKEDKVLLYLKEVREEVLKAVTVAAKKHAGIYFSAGNNPYLTVKSGKGPLLDSLINILEDLINCSAAENGI